MILSASLDTTQSASILGTVLISSLLIIVALAKSGSTIFYDTTPNAEPTKYKLSKSTLASIFFLFAFAPMLVLLANPISETTTAIAINLFDTSNYVSNVLKSTMEMQ